MVGEEPKILVVGRTSSDKGNDEGVTKRRITRKIPGSDGATSHHLVEKENGEAISKTHRVEKNGEVIHQHQDHISKKVIDEKQKLRQFPDEWIEYPQINKPTK